MAELQEMPSLRIPQAILAEWGAKWSGSEGSPDSAGAPTRKKPNRFDKKQGMEFGRIFDQAFGEALAEMLGGVPVVWISTTWPRRFPWCSGNRKTVEWMRLCRTRRPRSTCGQ